MGIIMQPLVASLFLMLLFFFSSFPACPSSSSSNSCIHSWKKRESCSGCIIITSSFPPLSLIIIPHTFSSFISSSFFLLSLSSLHDSFDHHLFALIHLSKYRTIGLGWAFDFLNFSFTPFPREQSYLLVHQYQSIFSSFSLLFLSLEKVPFSWRRRWIIRSNIHTFIA